MFKYQNSEDFQSPHYSDMLHLCQVDPPSYDLSKPLQNEGINSVNVVFNNPENINRENVNPENINSENINSENINSKNINPENVNSENVNPKNDDIENDNLKSVNPENDDYENVYYGGDDNENDDYEVEYATYQIIRPLDSSRRDIYLIEDTKDPGVHYVLKGEPKKKAKPMKRFSMTDLSSDLSSDLTLVEEYNLVSSFDHPGIIKYLSFEAIHDTFYIKMQSYPIDLFDYIYMLMKNNDLRKKGISGNNEIKIDENDRENDDENDDEEIIFITEEQQKIMKEIFLKIAYGLKYLHERNVLHRDIKPENILLMWDGFDYNNPTLPSDLIDRNFQAIITDFDLSTDLFFNKRGKVAGTLAQLPPEWSSPKTILDLHLSMDIWSYGVTLYESLTGTLPYPHKWDDRHHITDTIPHIDWIAEKSISSSKNSFKIFERALRGCLRFYPENRLPIENIIDILRS